MFIMVSECHSMVKGAVMLCIVIILQTYEYSCQYSSNSMILAIHDYDPDTILIFEVHMQWVNRTQRIC